MTRKSKKKKVIFTSNKGKSPKRFPASRKYESTGWEEKRRDISDINKQTQVSWLSHTFRTTSFHQKTGRQGVRMCMCACMCMCVFGRCDWTVATTPECFQDIVFSVRAPFLTVHLVSVSSRYSYKREACSYFITYSSHGLILQEKKTLSEQETLKITLLFLKRISHGFTKVTKRWCHQVKENRLNAFTPLFWSSIQVLHWWLFKAAVSYQHCIFKVERNY